MKRICKIYSLNDKNRVVKLLRDNGIMSKCEIKGPSILQHIPDKAVWFIISVKKNDYEIAKSVIKGLPKGDFEKELDLF